VTRKIGITSQCDKEFVENWGKNIKFKTRYKNIVSSELACALEMLHVGFNMTCAAL